MNMQKPLDPKLQKVYSNPENKRQLFDDWASTYDHDLINDLGYVGPQVASKKLMDLIPDKQSTILDIGCGTGLVARHLAEAGYSHIDGNDFSTEMLAKADECKIYNSLQQHDITTPLDSIGKYDVSISVGVFGFSPSSAEHLMNVINCNKKGGPAIVTINGKAWQEKDWVGQLQRFKQDHPEINIESVEPIDYLTGQGIDARLLVLRHTA
ncbi:MAG: putative TPR repeat methyltransferase [Parasphingorhabdus sp.]|jgi:predicted TPR repeat methyltransferase